MSQPLIVLLLAMLLGLQPVATDLYLPALPLLASGLGVSAAQAQLSLTALLLAFGISQLAWGPLSDRFGRRPILLWGLLIYVVAASASLGVTTLDQLLGWRALQGVAMGATVMCARAIVRDLYEPKTGALIMSKSMGGLGMIACLGGPLGGFLSDAYGWQVTLLALAVFGALTLALVALKFDESLKFKNKQALQPATLLRIWREIVLHRTFLAFSALGSASYAGLFCFLAGSPFVFIQQFGLTSTQFGWVLFTMPLAYIVGTFLCRWLLIRVGLRRTVAWGGAITLLAGCSIAALALLDWHNSWSIMLPFYLYMLGHGVHQPCSQSGSVAPFPKAAGAASALNGFLMMSVAFIVGLWLSSQAQTTVWPMVIGIAIWSLLTTLVAWTLVQNSRLRNAH